MADEPLNQLQELSHIYLYLMSLLPDDIRSCDNLNLFKRKLKTHLFKNYFNAWSLFLSMSSAYILDIRFMNIYILLMLT